MKKTLSLLLVLAMLLSMALLSSCDAAFAAAAIEKADKALEEAPYKATINMNFACDDAALNKVLSAMNMEVPMVMDGENLSFTMKTPVSETGTAEILVTLVDKVIYYEATYAGQTLKMKTTLNEEQYTEFMGEASTQMPVNATYFEKLSMETVDGKKVVTCSDLKAEGSEELNELIADALEGMEAQATVESIDFSVTIADDKYETMDLSVTYSITVAEKTYSVTLDITMAFAYGDADPVVAPEDTSNYQEVSYEDIYG